MYGIHVYVFVCVNRSVCILALDADIGDFEARSMGYSDCLNVYSLVLGPIHHLSR